MKTIRLLILFVGLLLNYLQAETQVHAEPIPNEENTPANTELTSANLTSSTSSVMITAVTQVDYTIHIGNTGNCASGGFYVTYLLRSNPFISGGIQFGSVYVPGLAPGAVTTLTNNINLCDVTSTSTSNLYVCYLIDATNLVNESNESDNDWHFTSPVSMGICSSQPDLEVTNSSFTTSGTSVDMQLNMRNAGGPLATPTTIGFYASIVGTFNNYLLGTQAVPGNLEPGDSLFASFSTDLCNHPSLPNADYDFFAFLDYQNVANESDEINNTEFWLSPTISTSPCNPDPNLSLASQSLTAFGPNILVNATVENDGNSPAGAFNIGYYASLDGNITTSDYLLGTSSVTGLAPGASISKSLSLNICTVNNLPVSNYRIGLIVDNGGTVSESNEGDNSYIWQSPTVSTAGCGGVGLDDPEHRNLNVYPNPTTGKVNLDWNIDLHSSGRISVTDVRGQVMYEKAVSAGIKQFALDLSELPTGMYFIHLPEIGWSRTLIQH